MGFSISPSVTVREIDLTGSVDQSLSSLGAIAIKAVWGAVNERILVSTVSDLLSKFGTPTAESAVDFMTAESFLAYTSGINVVRVGNVTSLKNAVSSGSAVAILNDAAYSQTASNISAISWVAKYAGTLGNSIAVSTCSTAAQFEGVLPGTWSFATSPRTKVATYTPNASELLSAYFNVGDFLVTDGVKYQVTALTNTTLTLNRIYVGAATPTTIVRRWQFADNCGYAPATNTVHVVVSDDSGGITKQAGTILETFVGISTVSGTKFDDGTSSYYIDVINTLGKWIRVGGLGIASVNTTTTKVNYKLLSGGLDGFSSLGTDDYLNAYDLFKNPDAVDAPLIIGGASAVGASEAVLCNYLVQNIAEVRKDGVVFFSPAMASVVNNSGNEVVDIITDRNMIQASSYWHGDSGWKYMYDRYNGVYRWIPLCGDSAGIYARTDREQDAWVSGAGSQRGIVKNVVKLSFSPDEVQRGQLYTNDINPITDFPVQGATLFGDKTGLGRNSVFSRMNVRRLFILLEKIIARATRDLLFEFNDDFTQRRFVNLVEPVLREIKGRRGITDYRVVCDASVNTPQVVQTNRFIGQIFIKPAASINFIRLDFVAVNQTASFDEVIGQV